MSLNISVACPTRHRPVIIAKYLESFYKTTNDSNRPFMTIIHDSPIGGTSNDAVQNIDNMAHEDYKNFRSVFIPEKSSLTELWNLSIILSPTDWALICNDDIIFKDGWLEYLEEKILENKYLIINLFNYGAMAIHKRAILRLGWFDERFRGGGFEDNDYQLRISEANFKGYVDRSHDIVCRTRSGKEIGIFIDHLRDEYKVGEYWKGENNFEFCSQKWRNNCNWRRPAFRMLDEPDWHPTYTAKYEKKFNERRTWPTITNNSITNKVKGIFQ